MTDRSIIRTALRTSRRFAQADDGSLTIFGLLIFMLMMTAGGIALDIMRSEVTRTELQYASDRASLAAAGLNQTHSAEEIVRDYLRAAGLDEDSVQVLSNQSGSERRVTISSAAQTDSLFLDLLGVDTLIQPISSEAREVRTELELSLVVDISGSMGGAKIETLRAAASDFVFELLRGREELTSISLVPYNDRVNAGSLVASVFDISAEHPFSNCVVFPDAQYLQLGMGPGDQLERMGHFDFRSNDGTINEPGLVANPNCRTDNYGGILPWSNDVGELQARIAALNANNWTAMDLGVKWGSLLLDPSSRDELADLVSGTATAQEDRIDSVFLGRPVDYNTDGTHKVLVVMTDGDNTYQWDLKKDRKQGPSGVHVYREPLADVCASYVRDAFWNNGRRVDGLSQDDGILCDGWDAANRPVPRSVGPDVPLLDALGGLVTAGMDGITINLLGKQVQARPFGATGAGCDVGTSPQRALCRARFDDDEGHRWVTRYSVRQTPASGAYWISHRRQYWSAPYGGNDAIELDWPEVFASLSMSYLANTILSGANWNMRVDFFNSWETTHGQSRADANLSNLCKTARDNGVIIYTIAFQAPDDGKAAMLDCAGPSNAGRYFDVENLDIAAAFDDVLASVSRLRLTQ